MLKTNFFQERKRMLHLLFELAYGGENYSILQDHISEDGWFNEDHIHDPVNTKGYETKEVDPKIAEMYGYSSNTWYRPACLSNVDMSEYILSKK